MPKYAKAQPAQWYLGRYKDLKAEKDLWNVHYQALAERFLTRKADFTSTITPGDFLHDDTYDNSAQHAAYLSASMIVSMMWPDAARTFRVKPTRRITKFPGVEAYFRFVTDELHAAMDNPRSGLQMALMEHALDAVVFGTSGPAAFEGEDDADSPPVVYEAWGIKTMCIDENAQGFVDTVYFSRWRSVRQLVEEYKDENVSARVRELYKEGKTDEKFEVLYVLEPKLREEGKKGYAGMSTRSVHIEMQAAHLLREKGFEEMPVFVSRMFKTVDEKYGRSPAMSALPDAVSLNVLAESVLVASEKQLDPPLGVLDDGRLGGAVVDTSAHGLTVFNSSGRLTNQNPVFPLFTVGEMQSAKDLMEALKQSVMQHFFLDRLLDLNNQTQMTAYETSVRNRMRGEALGSLFARQEMEVFTPLIERTFNILWRRGHLGVVTTGIGARLRKLWNQLIGSDDVIVPEVVVKAAEAGLDVFEIEYISPAKRFMQSEKLQGIFTASDALAALSPVFPGITDNVDADILAREIYRYAGAPTDSLRTADDLKDMRARMAAKQQAVERIEAGKGVSEIARNVGQALGTRAGGAPK